MNFSLAAILQWFTRNRVVLWRYAYIVSITFFLAKSINAIIVYKYLPIEIPRRPSSDFSAGNSRSFKEPSGEIIISRNLFDSEAPSRIRNAASGNFGSQIFPSSLPLDLMGTVVFQTGRFSTALIRERNSKKVQYYAIGDLIQSARVHKIERFRVILEVGNRLESLELKEAESKLSSQLKAPVILSDPGQPAFEERAPNQFVIPQSVVDETLNNFNVVLTQARMIPNLTTDNRTDGFKVLNIRQGSIYEKLGMKDQDIIKRVNGIELDSFEKATGLFTALRNEKSISIDLVRNGQRINYTYEIR